MGRNVFIWLQHALGLRVPPTQTTPAERACLQRFATGKRNLVEIGVMYGHTLALARRVMNPSGQITGIDPHPPGRAAVSFERWVTLRELGKYRRGKAVLLRMYSHEAVVEWREPIDFLFIDGDHSWQGIERDWRDWNPYIAPGGIVALHDSRSVIGRPDLESVAFTEKVILRDERFRQVDTADSLTVLQRV